MPFKLIKNVNHVALQIQLKETFLLEAMTKKTTAKIPRQQLRFLKSCKRNLRKNQTNLMKNKKIEKIRHELSKKWKTSKEKEIKEKPKKTSKKKKRKSKKSSNMPQTNKRKKKKKIKIKKILQKQLKRRRKRRKCLIRRLKRKKRRKRWRKALILL